MENIIAKAEELGQLIKESEITKKVDACRVAMEADAALQVALQSFNETREELFGMMNNSEENEEKANKLNDRLKELYEEITAKSIMSEFEEAQNAFEAMMKQVNETINYKVTGQQPSSCSSDCSSCGGCH